MIVSAIFLVLYGNYSSNGRETWEWRGARWILQSTSGPRRHRNHIMAYDYARKRVVLFGGSSGRTLRDTWEWDGINWESFDPSPRDRHAMAYDRNRLQAVLFGGYDGDRSDETWFWDGNTWVKSSQTGPDWTLRACNGVRCCSRYNYIFGGGCLL